MSRKFVLVLLGIFALQIAGAIALFISPSLITFSFSLLLLVTQLALIIEILKKRNEDNISFLKEYLSSFKSISSQIAHDFSNPMHVIQFCGSSLGKHVDERGKKYLDRIMNCTDRSVAMIDDLRELARVKQDEHKTFNDVHLFVLALVRLQFWKNIKPSSIYLDEQARFLPLHIPSEDMVTILYSIYRTLVGNSWAPVVEVGVIEVSPSNYTLKISSSAEFQFSKEDDTVLRKAIAKCGANLEITENKSLLIRFEGKFESIFNLYNNNSSSSHDETRLQ